MLESKPERGSETSGQKANRADNLWITQESIYLFAFHQVVLNCYTDFHQDFLFLETRLYKAAIHNGNTKIVGEIKALAL